MTASVRDTIPLVMSRAARVTATLVGAGSIAILLAYALRLDPLWAPRPGSSSVSPLTALALAALAAATALDRDSGTGATRLGWVAVVVGAGALLVTAMIGREPVTPFVAAHLFGLDPSRAGCVSVPTAICLLALGVASVFRDRPRSAS